MPYDHRREVEALRCSARRRRERALELQKEAEVARLKLLDAANAELAESQKKRICVQTTFIGSARVVLRTPKTAVDYPTAMNRRKFLSFASGAVASLPVLAAAQASKAENKKKCAEEGHQIGDPIKRTEFRTKHPLCTKVLLSSTCPRCKSDWTHEVKYEGECPKDPKAC